MKKVIVTTFAILFAFIAVYANAQYTEIRTLANPFLFPMQLSGGFCDLRANHYHAGIDIRTRGAEGQAMHAVQKGYISRISVSPWGYGLAVYITHPEDSLLTVYAHLQRFTRQMDERVKAKQYETESYTVDLTFEPGEFPVKKGDLIGYSGNSGSSGGPHLHFEVRELQTNDLLDPLAFYKAVIPDHRPPEVRGLRIYPIEGKGMVNGSNQKQTITSTQLEAWGEVGLGIRAIDRMDGTSFSYGIRDILLTADSVELFRSYTDRFSLAESRYINSYTDYEEWADNRIFYIKTFVEPGNNTRFVASRHNGILHINEERIYNVVISLKDIYGNETRIPIQIKGTKQEITPPDTTGTTLMRWYDFNTFQSKGIRLEIPRNSLYSSVYMRYLVSKLQHTDIAPMHTLHHKPVPLHNPARLSIHIKNAPAYAKSEQLGIVHIRKNGRTSWVGGTFRDHWIDAEINELGTYTIACDTTPPLIRPIEQQTWRAKKKISIRMTDQLSGIASYRGEIDGKYALFEFDGKKALITYTFDDERIRPGYHRLKLTVTDRCGNKSIYEHAFSW